MVKHKYINPTSASPLLQSGENNTPRDCALHMTKQKWERGGKNKKNKKPPTNVPLSNSLHNMFISNRYSTILEFTNISYMNKFCKCIHDTYMLGVLTQWHAERYI
jgi:hypothetical protein